MTRETKTTRPVATARGDARLDLAERLARRLSTRLASEEAPRPETKR